MNLNHEDELAAAIDRELKALPDLQAPPTLISRVLAAVERPVLAPWYRRAWQTWPLPLQAAAMVFLLAFAGAICFGGWQLLKSPGVTAAGHSASRLASSLTTLWTALNAVGGLVLLGIKQLNTSILIGIAAVVGLSWAACVGLGTVYIRLAFARR